MRRGEILNIALGHVDRKKGTILIPETKTSYPRTIPLPDEAWNVVTQRVNNIMSVSMPIVYDLNTFLIFYITPDAVSKAFARACKALNIKNLTFHDCRHEALSRLFERGLDMMEISLISGHKGFDMLKKYIQLRPETLLDRMNNR